MITGIQTPASGAGRWNRPPPAPTAEQEAAHAEAYGAFMDHFRECQDCQADHECETSRNLRRAVREVWRGVTLLWRGDPITPEDLTPYEER